MLELIVYIILCVRRGLCGGQRGMGLIETLARGIVATPLAQLPVLLLTGPSRRAEWRRYS